MCHRRLPTFRWECECAQSATALSHDETSYRRKLLNFDHCVRSVTTFRGRTTYPTARQEKLAHRIPQTSNAATAPTGRCPECRGSGRGPVYLAARQAVWQTEDFKLTPLPPNACGLLNRHANASCQRRPSTESFANQSPHAALGHRNLPTFLRGMSTARIFPCGSLRYVCNW